jgi:hypothetical protein
MGEYLDFLLKGSPDHVVESRGPNTFAITARHNTAEGYGKFDRVVRGADRRAAVEGFGVLKHPDSMTAGREFDLAIITVRETSPHSPPLRPNPSLWTTDFDDAAARIAASHS